MCTYTGRSSGDRVVSNIIKPKRFTSAATQFGKDNEELALHQYQNVKGPNVKLTKAGFFIHPDKGYLGATPDSLVNDNGDSGLVEVKCPIKFSTMSVMQAARDRSYPVKVVNGEYQLKTTHQYYHQIQFQLMCCNDFATFCDFVIFHVDAQDILILRIQSDQESLFKYEGKINNFYKTRDISELLKN